MGGVVPLTGGLLSQFASNRPHGTEGLRLLSVATVRKAALSATKQREAMSVRNTQ
jgi:hypothetical protein